jgi:hypothetical protein
VREKASHTQRLQKTLEDANIKLDSVISDLLGRGGRAMIEALAARGKPIPRRWRCSPSASRLRTPSFGRLCRDG